MSRLSNIANTVYERAYLRWQYTPKWRLIARARGRAEWKVWLTALSKEIKREAGRR